MPPETNIELDVPDERDYQYEDLFGSTEELPESILFCPATIQNQGKNPKTRMACSRYWVVQAINAQNKAVQEKDGMRYYEFQASNFWIQYIQVNPSAERDGATLQGALDQMLKMRLITGYTRVQTIQDMKQALSEYRPIYTGSKNANWNTVRDNQMYTLGTGYAHIFCIVGYNDKGWIAINSYWISNWVFSIPYDLTDSLFTRYALSDDRDQALFQK